MKLKGLFLVLFLWPILGLNILSLQAFAAQPRPHAEAYDPAAVADAANTAAAVAAPDTAAEAAAVPRPPVSRPTVTRLRATRLPALPRRPAQKQPTRTNDRIQDDLIAKRKPMVTTTGRREFPTTLSIHERFLAEEHAAVPPLPTGKINVPGKDEIIMPAPFAFICDRILGAGSYGTVYRCRTENEPAKLFALKEMDLFRDGIELNQENITELYILQKLQANPHPGLLSSHPDHPHFLYKGKAFVPLTLAHNSLHELIAARPSTDHLTFAYIQKFSRQLIDALEHLHQLGIVHRDLKPGNTLVYGPDIRSLSVMIGDFGLGTFLPPGDLPISSSKSPKLGTLAPPTARHPEFVATRGYRPPELFRPLATYDTRAIDKYGIGVKIAEMLLRRNLLMLPVPPEPFRKPISEFSLEEKRTHEKWKRSEEAQRLSHLFGNRMDGSPGAPAPVDPVTTLVTNPDTGVIEMKTFERYQNLPPEAGSDDTHSKSGIRRTLEEKIHPLYRDEVNRIDLQILIKMIEELTQWDPKKRAYKEKIKDNITRQAKTNVQVLEDYFHPDSTSDIDTDSDTGLTERESYLKRLRDFSVFITITLDGGQELPLSLILELHGFFDLFDEGELFEEWIENDEFPHMDKIHELIDNFESRFPRGGPPPVAPTVSHGAAAAAFVPDADADAAATPAAVAAPSTVCPGAHSLGTIPPDLSSLVPTLLPTFRKNGYKVLSSILATQTIERRLHPIVFHQAIHLLRQIFNDPTNLILPMVITDTENHRDSLLRIVDTILEVAGAQSSETFYLPGYWNSLYLEAKTDLEKKKILEHKRELLEKILKYAPLDSEKVASRILTHQYLHYQAQGPSHEAQRAKVKLSSQENFLLFESLTMSELRDEKLRLEDSQALAFLVQEAVRYLRSPKGDPPLKHHYLKTESQKKLWQQFILLLQDNTKFELFPLRVKFSSPIFQQIAKLYPEERPPTVYEVGSASAAASSAAAAAATAASATAADAASLLPREAAEPRGL